MERGLIFDCDGVLADTELHGHLVAFNRMWKKLGVNWQWSPEQYAEKLKIGGGKERMASLFPEQEFRSVFAVPESEKDREALIAIWHKEKTAVYKEISRRERSRRDRESRQSQKPRSRPVGSWQ
jgi:beta-phosphoglucomutase-like phosphatase (HAD superfamily)